MDNSLARAELYRDALHDLPDYDPAREAEILRDAEDIGYRAWLRMSEAERFNDWFEARMDRFIPQAEARHD